MMDRKYAVLFLLVWRVNANLTFKTNSKNLDYESDLF